jgi:hypothetical protein
VVEKVNFSTLWISILAGICLISLAQIVKHAPVKQGKMAPSWIEFNVMASPHPFSNPGRNLPDFIGARLQSSANEKSQIP